MIKKMYAIKDSKAEFYYPPAFYNTHAEAERSLITIVRKGDSQIAQHPEDFDLYYIGTYDDQTGKMSPTETPQHIVKAANLPALNS